MSWTERVSRLLGHCTSHGAFGVDTIHVPAEPGSLSQTLKGIWSDVYLNIGAADSSREGSAEMDVVVMSSDPNVGFRSSDFNSAPRRGDGITRNDGRQYTVRSVEPDGEGGVTLFVEQVL